MHRKSIFSLGWLIAGLVSVVPVYAAAPVISGVHIAPTPLLLQSQPPAINQNGVVEGAGFSLRVAGGAIASIFGTNLAPSAFNANTIPLPDNNMNGVTVRLNGDVC